MTDIVLSGEEFDELVDNGMDTTAFIDWPAFEELDPRYKQTRRISVDVPLSLQLRLDAAAERRGVTRQSLIKMWLTDCLDADDDRRAKIEVERARARVRMQSMAKRTAWPQRDDAEEQA
ncbi:type II toxin-antitoxin system BrnA family antitoxin [Collinsella tanakaei]|uniref:type II toxin-antitoxin system BrnA family antitoxin n=1 Tax=Collinsella tanakaei TaxID=626935 RepID=UPI0025A45966|nr:CopG family antitoxin [Collinsella tanakaei]MDM8302451.1 CopG family antitoxin [Collinsella tanakaei]